MIIDQMDERAAARVDASRRANLLRYARCLPRRGSVDGTEEEDDGPTGVRMTIAKQQSRRISRPRA